MIDFNSFADENFNAKSWVNNALQAHKPANPEEGVDAHASMLVMKLQLHSLELTTSLEETSSQALLSIPRAIREIEKVRKDATTLKLKMANFKEQLTAMEGTTGKTVEILETIDKVKERMELCMNTLKEASKLASFGQNIESVFTSGDYLKIAMTIKELRESLKIVGSVPEFRDQAQQLTKYQDRLEGLLRPQLLQAINLKQDEVVVSLRTVFQHIDRLDQFQQHYISCRLVPLRQAWDSFPSETAFPAWLPGFYDQLQNALNSDSAWAQQIFPGAQYQAVSTQLIISSLSSLSSSFLTRLEQTLFPPAPSPSPSSPIPSSSSHPNPNPNSPVFHTPVFVSANKDPPKLNLLIAAYSVASNFSYNVSAVIPDPNNRREVIKKIFEPFILFQKKYPAYEKQLLLSNLATLKPVLQGFLETVKQVGDTIGKVFIFAESAIERCLQFTHGVASEGLVSSLSDFFNEYVQQLFTLIQYLRVKTRLGIDPSLNVPAPPNSTPEAGNDSIHFEGALKLFHASNQLTTRIASFDRFVRSHLLDQRAYFNPHSGKSGEPTLLELQVREDPVRLRHLEKFFHTLETGTTRVLAMPWQNAMTFNGACQSFVFDIMFAYVKDRISTVPLLEEWRAVAKANEVGQELPMYQHPLPYITLTGDHLLTSLPQQLEPYADSLDRPLTLEDRARMKRSTPSLTPDSLGSALSSIIADKIADNPLASSGGLPDNGDGEKDKESENDADKETEEKEKEELDEFDEDEDEEEGTVAHQWIAAVAKGAMALYVKKILEIPVLTKSGANQLDTDIGYLFKVLSALDIMPDNHLVEVQRLITIPKEEYMEALKTQDSAYAHLGTPIKNMRGIGINVQQQQPKR